MRRAFLCGSDRFTDRNSDHRKPWLVERMKDLTAIFAIDICAYGVLQPYHLVLHVDRQRACNWTETQVAEHYAKLFPHTERATRTLPEKVRAKKRAE